jgi:hypothetical protein
MKQTAVEWYEKEINSLFEKYQAKEISERDFITMKHNLFYPAKEMEKEQIENAFNYAQIDLGMEADEYYNETFKSE